MIFAGLDTGSRTIKVAIMKDNAIISEYVGDVGHSSVKSSAEGVEEALKKVGLTTRDIDYAVSTGYGRGAQPYARENISDISAHARGAFWLFPTTRTVIDLGGQDCKAINLNETGRVIAFAMNEKCAGGTGRALEIIADVLLVPIEEIGSLSLKASKRSTLTSTCAVFAKGEALMLLQGGEEIANILAAYHMSVAFQCSKLLGRINTVPDLVLTGGVCKNVGVVQSIKEKFGIEPKVPPNPQMVGAIGAAARAREVYLKLKKEVKTAQ